MLFPFMSFQDECVVPSFVQEVSVDQGFGLALCFFQGLYSESRNLSNLPRIYTFVYVCLNESCLGMNQRSFKFWELAVSQVISLSLETKKIPTKDLLECIIAFSKLAKEQYFNLDPMTSLLEGIKKEPNKYPLECRLWEYIINNSYRKVVFPHAKSSTEKEVSVEHGFHIVNLFFLDLFFLFKDKGKEEDLDSCSTVIMYGFSYPSEWNEAIFRVMKIPKIQQKTINIPLKTLFVCLIEFVKIFDKRWKDAMVYLINYLESIEQNPADFPVEMKLWKDVIENSYSRRSLQEEAIGDPYPYSEFDWEAELPDNEKS